MSDPLTPEEQARLAAELAEQLASLRIEDVVVNALMTASAVGYRRLGVTPETREARDLEQARLAIETMRALVPLLEDAVPGELVRDLNQSVANLQLAYAKAASTAAAPDDDSTSGNGEDAPPAG